MSKVSTYTALTTVQPDDVLPVVDIHDTTMAATGTTKKITVADLRSVDWINAASDYGADPSGAADSTTQIQAAITAAATAGGGVVYVPPGTYKLTAALTMSSNITLQGAGPQVSILNQTSATADGVAISGAANVYYPQVKELGIYGPGSGSGRGISVIANGGANPVVGFVARDLYVYHFGGYGLDLSTIIASTIDTVQAINCGGGFFLRGSGGCTSVGLRSCYADGCNGRGFYFSGAAYCHLDACASDSNYLGYEIANGEGITLSGCGAEATVAGGGLDGSSFKVSGGPHAAIGCYAAGNGAVAFNHAAGYCSWISCYENSPIAGATASFAVLSGAKSVILLPRYTTAMSIAGSTTMLFDVINGQWSAIGSGSVADVTAYAAIDAATAGAGLQVAEGSNAKQGITGAMTAGTITVANTSVTANSRIFLTAQNTGGTPGALRVSARSAGTSFTITSSSATDTSTVAYEIFEPG